jgi:hypothetical protein
MSTSPTAWLAAILLVAALFGGTYFKGRTDGKAVIRAEWDADANRRKVAEEKAIADRLRANQKQAAQFELDKRNLKKGYADEIASIRRDRSSPVELRLPSSICDGSTATLKSDSTGRGATDPAVTRLLPPATSADLLALMQQADEIVAGCRVAQEFIQSQGMEM